MNNEIGKEQTIGVEIEFAGITRATAAKKITDFFGTIADHKGGSYDAYEIKDRTGRVWKIVSDSSIKDIPERRCELVTPILQYEDIETLQEVARQIRNAGGLCRTEFGVGVHVHIGAKDHTAQSLRNLTNLMASHENLLVDSLKVDHDRINKYCKTVDPVFLKAVNEKKPKTMSEFQKIWYNGNDESYIHKHRSRAENLAVIACLNCLYQFIDDLSLTLYYVSLGIR